MEREGNGQPHWAKELPLDTAGSLCLVGRSFLSLMKRCEERRVKARPTRYQVPGLRKKALREISLLSVGWPPRPTADYENLMLWSLHRWWFSYQTMTAAPQKCLRNTCTMRSHSSRPRWLGISSRFDLCALPRWAVDHARLTRRGHARPTVLRFLHWWFVCDKTQNIKDFLDLLVRLLV